MRHELERPSVFTELESLKNTQFEITFDGFAQEDRSAIGDTVDRNILAAKERIRPFSLGRKIGFSTYLVWK